MLPPPHPLPPPTTVKPKSSQIQNQHNHCYFDGVGIRITQTVSTGHRDREYSGGKESVDKPEIVDLSKLYLSPMQAWHVPLLWPICCHIACCHAQYIKLGAAAQSLPTHLRPQLLCFRLVVLGHHDLKTRHEQRRE